MLFYTKTVKILKKTCKNKKKGFILMYDALIECEKILLYLHKNSKC